MSENKEAAAAVKSLLDRQKWLESRLASERSVSEEHLKNFDHAGLNTKAVDLGLPIQQLHAVLMPQACMLWRARAAQLYQTIIIIFITNKL